MTSSKKVIAALSVLVLLPLSAMAIKLIYKDDRGVYHYRCTEKTGGVTTVTYRAEGIYVDGPKGQKFFPMDTAPIVRSEDYALITKRYARWGCREKLLR
jgi:hypothetical protein